MRRSPRTGGEAPMGSWRKRPRARYANQRPTRPESSGGTPSSRFRTANQTSITTVAPTPIRTAPPAKSAASAIRRLLSLALGYRRSHFTTSSRLEVKRVKDLDIAEVAQRSGVPASTLRFYEEKGLIATTGRRGLRRLFDPGVLERLALIALGRAAGFSLDEIARMFAPDGRPRIDRKMLAAKAEELDGKIRELSALRDGLRHAVACTAPSHMECRKFRRLMRAAAAG